MELLNKYLEALDKKYELNIADKTILKEQIQKIKKNYLNLPNYHFVNDETKFIELAPEIK